MKIPAQVFGPERRSRTLALVVMLLLLLLAYCVARRGRPLPPPAVALHLMSLRPVGANLVATLSFTNVGQTEVCLWDQLLWELRAETTAGRITRQAPFASVCGEAIPPGSNRVFAVPMPLETTQWQVSTTYGFQKKLHIPSKFQSWAWSSRLVQRSPTPVSDAVAWCLDLLPSAPLPTHGEVCTPVITNEMHFYGAPPLTDCPTSQGTE